MCGVLPGTVKRRRAVNTPTERQAQILEWLGSEGSIRLAELAARLGVSLMTVHRDTAALAELGSLVKGHGVIERVQPGAATVRLCPMCRTPILDRLRFSFTARSGENREACCGHCALMLVRHDDELSTLLATDFLYGRVMSAAQAHYVANSRVAACCKPSVLPFLTAEDAADFARAFGGEVMALSEVRAAFAH